jgi:hypothetical protein
MMNDLLIEPFRGLFDIFKKEVSPDRSYYLLYFLLGNASLLGFNSLINTIDISNTQLARWISGDLDRVYNIPSALMALFLCLLKPKNTYLFLIIERFPTLTVLCILPLFS